MILDLQQFGPATRDEIQGGKLLKYTDRVSCAQKVPWFEIRRVPSAASAIALGLSNFGVEDDAALDAGIDRWGVPAFEFKWRNRMTDPTTNAMMHITLDQRRWRRWRASRVTASEGKLSAAGRRRAFSALQRAAHVCRPFRKPIPVW